MLVETNYSSCCADYQKISARR